MDILDKANQAQTVEPDKDVLRGQRILEKYRTGKLNFENKIIENERWYRSQHWDIIRGKAADTKAPEPVTSYLFSTIANKHADAMDNFPEPNILAREEQYEQVAEQLSNVVPLVLDKANFRLTYKDAWWYKLKQGVSCFGVFWNNELERGLGDIDIRKIDLLNVYFEPGINDIQDSKNVFIVSVLDNDFIESEYPIMQGQTGESRTFDVKQYVSDDKEDVTDKSLVVDWYYKKKNSDGKTVLHMIKFCNDIKISSTEEYKGEEGELDLRETGLYEHGLYPFVFDVLFPEENTPVGFGYIDLVKNEQMYIDKLDQIICNNALASGKLRWLVKNTGGVDAKKLIDFSQDVVEVEGNIGEDNYRQIQVQQLNPQIIEHRRTKIEEMKDVAGSNDFSRGNAGAGVTSGSAIAALQEAGGKLSRDMIADSYSNYTKVVYMVIELIKQFYTEARQFRIQNADGTAEYTAFSNNQLTESAVFDIKIKPEKANPYSKLANNELAKELFREGFFNPQMADSALIALEMMNFEGKQKIVQMVSQNKQIQQQIQGQSQEMAQMAALIQHYSGEDMGADPTQQPKQPQQMSV